MHCRENRGGQWLVTSFNVIYNIIFLTVVTWVGHGPCSSIHRISQDATVKKNQQWT